MENTHERLVARESHTAPQRWRNLARATAESRLTTVRLQHIHVHRKKSSTNGYSSVPPLISPQVLKTFPIFVIAMLITTGAFFNYQKQESSVVTSTLYALRTNPGVRELLGDEIYFASKYPWIKGEINQVHGRIDIRFWVKGTKRQGEVRLRCRRRGRGGLYATQEWSLTMNDGERVELYDPKGDAIDPFSDPIGEDM